VRQNHLLLTGALIGIAPWFRTASAQTLPRDSIVRVTTFNSLGSWQVIGRIVSLGGDSVIVRAGVDSIRVAMDRRNITKLEGRFGGHHAGKYALVGCFIGGAALGLLGAQPTQGGDGPESIPLFAAIGAVGGCAIGLVIGVIVGHNHTGNWQAIPLPPVGP
jgi:hypothetical protein